MKSRKGMIEAIYNFLIGKVLQKVQKISFHVMSWKLKKNTNLKEVKILIPNDFKLSH